MNIDCSVGFWISSLSLEALKISLSFTWGILFVGNHISNILTFFNCISCYMVYCNGALSRSYTTVFDMKFIIKQCPYVPVHLFSLLKWNGTVRPVAVVIKKIYISFGIDRLCSLLCVAVIIIFFIQKSCRFNRLCF